VREQQAAERESKERERETGSPPNLTQLKQEPRKEGAVAWLAILLHMRYYCCRTAARAGT
jgi:hypothetical protein